MIITASSILTSARSVDLNGCPRNRHRYNNISFKSPNPLPTSRPRPEHHALSWCCARRQKPFGIAENQLNPFSSPSCSSTALANNSHEPWEDKGLLDFRSRTLTIRVIFGPQHSLPTQRLSTSINFPEGVQMVIEHLFLNELFTMLQKKALN